MAMDGLHLCPKHYQAARLQIDLPPVSNSGHGLIWGIGLLPTFEHPYLPGEI